MNEKTSETAVGVVFSLVAFSAVVWVFARFLGWPNSVATLGIVLSVAFLVGAGAGNVMSRRAPTTIVPFALAIALGMGSVLAGIPWEKAQVLFGGAQAQENVPFRTEDYFYLLGTEDNEVVENIEIVFPTPQIENKYIPNIFKLHVHGSFFLWVTTERFDFSRTETVPPTFTFLWTTN